jgi:hypothetical protein
MNTKEINVLISTCKQRIITFCLNIYYNFINIKQFAVLLWLPLFLWLVNNISTIESIEYNGIGGLYIHKFKVFAYLFVVWINWVTISYICQKYKYANSLRAIINKKCWIYVLMDLFLILLPALCLSLFESNSFFNIIVFSLLWIIVGRCVDISGNVAAFIVYSVLIVPLVLIFPHWDSYDYLKIWGMADTRGGNIVLQVSQEKDLPFIYLDLFNAKYVIVHCTVPDKYPWIVPSLYLPCRYAQIIDESGFKQDRRQFINALQPSKNIQIQQLIKSGRLEESIIRVLEKINNNSVSNQDIMAGYKKLAQDNKLFDVYDAVFPNVAYDVVNAGSHYIIIGNTAKAFAFRGHLQFVTQGTAAREIEVYLPSSTSIDLDQRCPKNRHLYNDGMLSDFVDAYYRFKNCDQ